MKHPILGRLAPDPVGKMLATNYLRFEAADGVNGLCKIACSRLDILAIHSRMERRGHVRALIERCKESFGTICVWEIWNKNFEQALMRWGFTPEIDITDLGEAIHGLRWDKSAPSFSPSEKTGIKSLS